MTIKGGRIRRAYHEPSANEIADKPKSLNVRSSMRRPAFREVKSHAIRSAFCCNRTRTDARKMRWGHIGATYQATHNLTFYLNILMT